MTENDTENDSASGDDDTDSQVGKSSTVHSLTPLRPIRNGTSWPSTQTLSSASHGTIAAVNAFKDLDDDHEYGSSMIEARFSWASEVHVKPIKTRKTINMPYQSNGENINNMQVGSRAIIGRPTRT